MSCNLRIHFAAEEVHLCNWYSCQSAQKVELKLSNLIKWWRNCICVEEFAIGCFTGRVTSVQFLAAQSSARPIVVWGCVKRRLPESICWHIRCWENPLFLNSLSSLNLFLTSCCRSDHESHKKRFAGVVSQTAVLIPGVRVFTEWPHESKLKLIFDWLCHSGKLCQTIQGQSSVKKHPLAMHENKPEKWRSGFFLKSTLH